MLAAIQNVSASFLPSATAAIPTGERLSLLAEDAASALITPSFIVNLGALPRAPLTYNADGLLETQAAPATAVTSSDDAVTPIAVRADSTAVTTATVLSAVQPAETESGTAADTAPAPAISISAAAVADTATPFIPGAPGTTDVAAAAPPIASIPGAAAATDDAISFVASLPGIFTVTPAADGGDSVTTLVPTVPGAIAVAVPEVPAPPAAGPDPALTFIPTPSGAVAIVAPALPIAASAPAADAVDPLIPAPPGVIAFAPPAATTPPTAAADPATVFIPAPAGAIAVGSAEPVVVPPSAGETDIAGTNPASVLNAAVTARPTSDITIAAATTAVAADAEAQVTQPVPETIAVTAPAQSLASLVATTGTPAPAATAVAADAAGAVQGTPTLVDAAALAHRNIAQNPFYAGLAATMYVNAMVFRLQQSSSAELPQFAESVQPVAGLRAVAPVSFQRNGPADEDRDGGSLERRTIAEAIGMGTAHGAVGG